MELANLEIANDFPVDVTFICKQTIQNWYPQPLLYLTLTYQNNIPLALNHPRASYWTTRDHPYRPEPAKIIQTVSLKFAQTFLSCFAHFFLQKPQ